MLKIMHKLIACLKEIEKNCDVRIFEILENNNQLILTIKITKFKD